MPYPNLRFRNFTNALRAPAFVTGVWRQGQKGSFAPRGFGVTVINSTGSDIAADKLVAIDVTMDATTLLPKVVLANNSTVGHNEIYVTNQIIHNGKTGIVYSGGFSAKTLNTSSGSANAQVFLDSVSGGFTATAPTGVNQRVIPVGYIITSSASVGQIEWDIQAAELFVNNALVATGTISSANITGTSAGQFGHAQGVIMVPAPGAGKALVLENCVASYVFGTAAYTGGGNTTVNFGSGGSAITGVVSAANFAGAGANKPVQFVPLSTVGFALTANVSLNLVAAAAFTQPGTAAGVINWTITFQVVTL
jgi:hypothetical protein